MSDRDFSDSVKLEVIKSNLEKNNGDIRCEACGKKVTSISECHFDHVFPYSKGGKSIAENCQILCADCNLKKNNKLFKEFLWEEKAKKFLRGEKIEESDETSIAVNNENSENHVINKTEKGKVSKEQFDESVRRFINKKGKISKVDFTREYNNLPSVWYVKEYYGSLKELKKAFGIDDLDQEWNRETIKDALIKFVDEHGDFSQKDMKKANRIPTTMCILKHYPECKTIAEFKEKILGLDVPVRWDKETAITHGKAFLDKHKKITQKDLKASNGLPTSNVIYRLFGSLGEYQAAVGSAVNGKNVFITKNDIRAKLVEFFGDKEWVIESRTEFFKNFPISEAVVQKRYNGFLQFCKEEKITVKKIKKAKYSKREIDDAISNWVKQGKPMPKAKDLAKEGLPSYAAILKYYEDWKEPFIIYQKLHEEAQRVDNG